MEELLWASGAKLTIWLLSTSAGKRMTDFKMWIEVQIVTVTILFLLIYFADQNTCLSDNWLLPWWRTLPAFGQTTHEGPEGRCSEVNYLPEKANVVHRDLRVCYDCLYFIFFFQAKPFLKSIHWVTYGISNLEFSLANLKMLTPQFQW